MYRIGALAPLLQGKRIQVADQLIHLLAGQDGPPGGHAGAHPAVDQHPHPQGNRFLLRISGGGVDVSGGRKLGHLLSRCPTRWTGAVFQGGGEIHKGGKTFGYRLLDIVDV